MKADFMNLVCQMAGTDRTRVTRPRSGVRIGFTLIELLVVIAIIALLAAIIFPVFATVRENARQTNSMSNLHNISTKLEFYRMDTHTYPPVLFGYAVPQDPTKPQGPFVPMDKALATCTADNNCTTYLVGLYPEYVNSIGAFKDMNNPVTDMSKTVPLNKLFMCTGSTSGTPNPSDDTACPLSTPNSPNGAGAVVVANGTLNPSGGAAGGDDPHTYYVADAYDISPRVIDGSTTDDSDTNGPDYIVRYSPSWTSIDSDLDCGNLNSAGVISPQPPGEAEGFCGTSTPPTINDYLYQLRWRNPPGETYVTSTTYHTRAGGKVLVLTQDGTAIKVGSAQFAALEPPGSVTPPNGYGLTVDGNGVSTGKFWLITPVPGQ